MKKFNEESASKAIEMMQVASEMSVSLPYLRYHLLKARAFLMQDNGLIEPTAAAVAQMVRFPVRPRINIPAWVFCMSWRVLTLRSG